MEGKPNTVVPEAEHRCSHGCVAAAQHETFMGGAAAASDVQRHAFGILRALRANFDGDLLVTPIKNAAGLGWMSKTLQTTTKSAEGFSNSALDPIHEFW